MDRPSSSDVEHRSSVRSAGPGTQYVVLRASGRIAGQLGADALDRSVVCGTTFLRQSQDRAQTGRKSQTCATVDAEHGNRSHLSETSHDACSARDTRFIPTCCGI